MTLDKDHIPPNNEMKSAQPHIYLMGCGHIDMKIWENLSLILISLVHGGVVLFVYDQMTVLATEKCPAPPMHYNFSNIPN